ncbi:MAG: helix-turn-helix domain-containing protein [Fibrobacterota bacterium]|nr:helix-turn-helix domain-containing protein [Fibrobacterota bacterium]
MSDESNDTASKGREQGETGIGRSLREARQAANIDVNKICSDLRIAPQTLDALESGNYHLLPGDPYIRALLGSVGRYLNIDPISLLQGYNKEIGAVHAAPSIAPYKDRTQTHTATHKQIFIGIFAVLFIILFLLFRKLNVNEDSVAVVPPMAAPTTDTLAPAQDTLLESKSLAPDSSLSKPTGPVAPAGPVGKPADSAKTPKPDQTGVPAPAGATGTVLPGSAPATAAIDSAGLIMAVVKPLMDSVGVKVMRYGKEDFSTVLRLGKQMQVSHTDTITVMVSKRKSVEVTIGGKTVIPAKKRFKIYGNNLKAF